MPGLLALVAAASLWRCLRGQEWSREEAERQRLNCLRGEDFPAVRTAGDTKTRFADLLEGKAFEELSPKVLSVDPLIVYFDTFMSEEEVAACEERVFTLEFQKSQAGYGGKSAGRHSDSAYCIDSCDTSDIVQTIQKRASNISGVPIDNFDFMQALRYREGMYFTAHNDNHPTFHLLPCGTRIFSFFVYLSDEGLEGGGTNFPEVQVSVPAKRGAAVLFANVLDDDPMKTDGRSMHESLPVTKGEKRGLNLWLYQYNFRHFWQKGCTTIELADHLSRLGKTAVPDAGESIDSSPAPPGSSTTVTFHNERKKAVSVYWVDPQGGEQFMIHVDAGSQSSLTSFEGHRFLVKTADGRPLKRYTTKGGDSEQHVTLRPPAPKEL